MLLARGLAGNSEVELACANRLSDVVGLLLSVDDGIVAGGDGPGPDPARILVAPAGGGVGMAETGYRLTDPRDLDNLKLHRGRTRKMLS